MAEKRIYLYMTPFFPSPESWRGGFCYDAVRALIRDGRYDVRVMTIGGGNDYFIDGIKVLRFDRRKIGSCDYCPYLMQKTNERLFMKKLRAEGISHHMVAVCHVHEVSEYAIYAHALKRLNPDCLTLVTHHWMCDWASTAFGRWRYVPILSELQYFWLYWLNKKFDAHVFVSRMNRSGFGRYLTGIEAWSTADLRNRLLLPRIMPKMVYKDSYVLYNGVDTHLFKSKRIPHDDYVIGCVGNFTDGKRQIDLIKAMPLIIRDIPNVRVRFIGSGNSLHECMRLASALDLQSRVEFLKEIEHTDMAKFYNGIDLLVLPSVNEAFCCVLVEAYACGVPFVCTNRISAREVLTEPSSEKFLFEPYNIHDLAAKIAYVHNTREMPELTVNLDIDTTTRDFLKWIDGGMSRHEHNDEV